MTVEKLIKSKNGDSRLTVLFDDQTKLRIPSYFLVDFDLHQGRTLSDEEYAALVRAAEKEAAKNRAVRIITASALSEKKLEQRLREKGTSAEDAAETVEWLHELHLTDDAKTAAMLVASAVRKGYGRKRIEAILYEKGIAREYWDEALADLPDGSEEIDRYLHRMLDGKPADRKLVQKTSEALMRRGYAWEEIRSALSRYRETCPIPDPEDVE